MSEGNSPPSAVLPAGPEFPGWGPQCLGRGGVSRDGSHPGEKPTAPPIPFRTQAHIGTPEHLHLTAAAGRGLQEGVAGGPGGCGASARRVNEEVIQLARISPSAAFIRSRSSSAIRGRERRSDTVGMGGGGGGSQASC